MTLQELSLQAKALGDKIIELEPEEGFYAWHQEVILHMSEVQHYLMIMAAHEEEQ